MYCNICRKRYIDKDKVFLDVFNTVTHQRCYEFESDIKLKDLGSFKEIVNRYDFFEQLIDG